MTEQKVQIQIQKLIKRAEKKGIKVHKNNIHRAKSLSSICGAIKAKGRYSIDDLLCR